MLKAHCSGRQAAKSYPYGPYVKLQKLRKELSTFYVQIGDIIAGGTRMACRDCKTHIISHKERWTNLDTLLKQPKPKTKRQAKRQGKAHSKQKGRALPAPPLQLWNGRGGPD
eukprot:376692-Amphidinium_carterae.1